MKDTKEILTCPACGGKMTKIQSSEGFFIDVCLDGCGGMYFDNRELEKLDEKSENIDFILKAIEGRTFKKVSQSETRICPACGSKMVKNFASARHEIEIDSCYSCGGKFLDCGELEAIRKQFDTDEQRSADFHQDFMKQYSTAILANERETQRLERERFIFGRIFNGLYNIRKSANDRKFEQDRKDLKEMIDLVNRTR